MLARHNDLALIEHVQHGHTLSKESEWEVGNQFPHVSIVHGLPELTIRLGPIPFDSVMKVSQLAGEVDNITDGNFLVCING